MGLEEGFAGGRVAGLDDLAGVGLEGVEVRVAERLGRLVVLGAEFVAAGVQAVEFAGQLGNPRGAGVLGHAALFECVEVALECLVGFLDLGVDALAATGLGIYQRTTA